MSKSIGDAPLGDTPLFRVMDGVSQNGTSPEIIEGLLNLEGEEKQALYDFADEIRRKYVGDEILTRGIIEFSNVCDNGCYYCGINKDNRKLLRYTLTKEDILLAAEAVVNRGIGTVILQSGENGKFDARWLADVIREIKSKFKSAVTLCVGEKSRDDYKLWRDAGADRYLLKIETSNKGLYEYLHPGMDFENRLRCLRDLKELGYETGSGIIIGLPGQTPRLLADDIIFFKEWDFDMIGIGPFIPHSMTELAGEKPGDAELTLKVLALTRIVTKRANLPATTALGTLDNESRQRALKCGANVIMYNFTPAPYRNLYEIYPNKELRGHTL